jgi:hypothetical protein
MNNDFMWYKKQRLAEQLKFFGAKKTKFISCYAKKPRVRIYAEKPLSISLRDITLQQGNGLLAAQQVGLAQYQAQAATNHARNAYAGLGGIGMAGAALTGLLTR